MIFLYLIFSHLLADFVFQPGKLVAWKQKSWKGTFVHSVTHFLVGLLVLWAYLGHPLVWGILLFIAVLHFFIDEAKLRHEKKVHHYLNSFLWDQAGHLVILVMAGLFIYDIQPLMSKNSLLMSFYGNIFIVLYFIIAVLLTYFTEIAQFQLVRQRVPEAHFAPNFQSMFARLLLFGFLYAIFVSVANGGIVYTLF